MLFSFATTKVQQKFILSNIYFLWNYKEKLYYPIVRTAKNHYFCPQ